MKRVAILLCTALWQPLHFLLQATSKGREENLVRKVQPYSPSLPLSYSLALAMHKFGVDVATRGNWQWERWRWFILEEKECKVSLPLKLWRAWSHAELIQEAQSCIVPVWKASSCLPLVGWVWSYTIQVWSVPVHPQLLHVSFKVGKQLEKQNEWVIIGNIPRISPNFFLILFSGDMGMQGPRGESGVTCFLR